MHRGGGPGEGTDDLGPESARRGRHRRRRSEEPASGNSTVPGSSGPADESAAFQVVLTSGPGVVSGPAVPAAAASARRPERLGALGSPAGMR